MMMVSAFLRTFGSTPCHACGHNKHLFEVLICLISTGNYSRDVNHVHVDNAPSVFSSSTVAQTSKGVQDLNRYVRLKKRSALKRRLDHDDDVQLQDEPSTNSSTPAPMLEPDPVNKYAYTILSLHSAISPISLAHDLFKVIQKILCLFLF